MVKQRNNLYLYFTRRKARLSENINIEDGGHNIIRRKDRAHKEHNYLIACHLHLPNACASRDSSGMQSDGGNLVQSVI